MQPIDLNNITTNVISGFSNDHEVSVLRLDKIHPIISGNKWFKLKFYLEEAKIKNKKRIITFGGAYSNHIIATAEACILSGFKSAAIIRGEEPVTKSHTLQMAAERGMKLYFVSRNDYRNKLIPENILINEDEDYFIPEGGFGLLGAAGAATTPYNKEQYDHIFCAVGTGTWMAGLINGKGKRSNVTGISILKNNFELNNIVTSLLTDKTLEVNIIHDYHFGGYAKYNKTLITFMNEFYRQTQIPTDFVYTAKMFYAVKQLLHHHFLKKDEKVLIIHCGGLQGNLSLQNGTLIF